MSSTKSDIGIKCLSCGRSQLPPNRASLDNWTCGHCYSGFLSVSMLANLIPRDLLSQITRKKKSAAKGRGCPLCRRAMEIAEVVEKETRVELELCRPCRFLWLDSGAITRLLRLRPLERFAAENLERLVEANKKILPVPSVSRKTVDDAAAATFIPWMTVALFVFSAVLVPVGAYFPLVLSRFGFLPAQPFRGAGLTLVTSLFLNHATQMHFMLVLLIAGTYVERRIGVARYVQLFVISGIIGRLAYSLSGGAGWEITIGSGTAVAGVVAYTVLTMPLREFLFPEERWRSPATGLAWLLIAGVTVVIIILGWDFFHMAFRRIGAGASGVSTRGTLLSTVIQFLSTPGCRAYLAAAAVGVVWLISEPLVEKAPRKKAA